MLSIFLIILVLLLFYWIDYYTILKATYPIGQLAYLEEDLLTNPIKSSIKIALRDSCPCYYPCRNFFLIDHVEDRLTRDPSPTNNSHLGSTSSTLFYKPTPGPALFLAFIPAQIPAPALALLSFDNLFKQFMKAYLESNQRLKQPPAEREQFFKAKMPDVYYKKLYMDCYHFCQQCKDYFETPRATRANRTPFAVFLLCKNISEC